MWSWHPRLSKMFWLFLKIPQQYSIRSRSKNQKVLPFIFWETNLIEKRNKGQYDGYNGDNNQNQ